MRKPEFCLCENKGADQLRSNCGANQRHCFRYKDSIISLHSTSDISSLWPFSVFVQLSLCWTRSETTKTGFLASRLIRYRLFKWTLLFRLNVYTRWYIRMDEMFNVYTHKLPNWVNFSGTSGKKRYYTIGVGCHSNEEVEEMMKCDLRMLSELLGK